MIWSDATDQKPAAPTMGGHASNRSAKNIRRLHWRGIAARVAVAVLLAGPTFAQTDNKPRENSPDAFRIATPINCPAGETCWIVNYVDQDRSRNALDYRCGGSAKDRYRSTDFATANRHAPHRSVPVVASAPGLIIGIRNDMDDNIPGKRSGHLPKNRLCGNGVLIEHTGGWTTQYCHLRKASVSVKKHQKVVEGQKIGLMGMSGQAAFPYLGFTVRHNKATIDPFIGLEPANECGPGVPPLWKTPDDPVLAYHHPKIERGGFSELRPGKDGPPPRIAEHPVMSRQIRAIFLWADFKGLRPGDKIWFRVFSPNGDQVLELKTPIKRHFLNKRVYVEFRKRGKLWPGGQYHGTIILQRREGSQIKNYAVEHDVEMR